MRIRQCRQLLLGIIGLTCCSLLCMYGHSVLYPEKKGNASYIVIFTSMRSGSTFAGSLFENGPDVFYTFETLYALHELNNQELKYLKRPSRKKNDYVEEATDIIKSVFECRFRDLDLETLTTRHFAMSRQTEPYFKCIEKNWRNASRPIISKCLHHLEVPCSTSRVHVGKEIRLPIQSMDTLLASSQSVKMIHLIRDPRATILSQMMYGFSPSSFVYPYAKKMCNKLLEDAIVRESLEKKYPGQIKVLYYEHLAQYPVRVTKELYDFAELPFTANVETYVRNITSSFIHTSCTLCVYKRNSTYESMKWRKKIKWASVAIMEDLCRPLYKKLGYVPLQSVEHLRDLQRPLLGPMQGKWRFKSA